MGKTWMIQAAVRSGMGRVRRNNEDSYYCNGSFHALQDMDIEAAETAHVAMDGALFAVCDGIGGENNGEVASCTAVSSMPDLQRSLANRDFEVTLQNWVRQINRRVVDCCDKGGCTMALLYFESRTLRMAHIGDSRIYRFHAGELTQLTQDHSKVQMLISAGVITPEAARTHPQRHIITRYIGMSSDSMTCEATIGRPMPAMNGDRYVICSDGVTDMLTDEQIRRLLAGDGNVGQCADSIYRAALDAGGRDNTTIILLEIEGEEAEDGLYLAMDDDDDETTVDEECEEAPPIQQTLDMNISHTIAPGNTGNQRNMSIHITLSQ